MNQSCFLVSQESEECPNKILYQHVKKKKFDKNVKTVLNVQNVVMDKNIEMVETVKNVKMETKNSQNFQL